MLLDYILLLLGGFAAGWINTLAGSGSLITLPILLMVGLPAPVANGTNRIGILLQNIVATRALYKAGKLEPRSSWSRIVPGVFGAVAGSLIAVELSERATRGLIAAVMVIMFFVIWLKPKRWLQTPDQAPHQKLTPIEWLVYLACGFYAGLIQAGVGILLLAGLVLSSGYDLVRANGVKLLFVLVLTVPALVIFAINNQVHWKWGLVLALGNMAGAQLGARTALKKGVGYVRGVLLAVVGISALKLLYDLFIGQGG